MTIYTINFDSVREIAKLENKDIIIFVTTKYCAACDRMKMNILSDSAVISFLNSNFIFFEFNTDKANEELKTQLRKFNKKGWPRMYFIDSDENIKYTQVGCGYDKNPEEFLVMWKRYETLEAEWKELRKRIKKDPISYNDINTYLMFGKTNYDIQLKLYYQFGFRKKIHRYFNRLDKEHYSDKKNWKLYSFFNTKSDEFIYLENHRDQFEENIGKQNISNYLFIRYYYNLYTLFNPKKRRQKKATEEPYISTREAKDALFYFDLINSENDEDLAITFAKLDSLKGYKSVLSLGFINKIAWKAYKESNDSLILQKAYSWSSILIEYDRETYYLDTHAKLASKIGFNDEAERIEIEIRDLKFEQALMKDCKNGVCKIPSK